MNGNAHKESCLKLLLILILEREGIVDTKADCSGKMLVAFTIKEKPIPW